jgi:cell wall-associated NlpC family hydrolase
MPHSTTHHSALRASARTTARLLGVLGLAAGVLLTVLAPSYAAHGHRAHQPRHHHVVRHHHGPRHSAVGHSAGRVAHAMSIAVAQRGKPYVYGASGPGAFDCSGLTSFAFHRAGFGSLPRTSAAQAHFVRHIPRTRMHRGDLIFFTGGGGVYHVGLYAGFSHGHRMVLHAPYPGRRVTTQPLWTDSWFAGTLRYR